MLTGNEIKFYATKTDKIRIDPFVESHIGPNSVDLTLAPELLVYGTEEEVQRLRTPETRIMDGAEYAFCGSSAYRRVLDMKRDNPTVKLTIPEEGLVLLPWQLYLGCTNEYTETHGFVPCIETRSSVARLGVQVHLSAGAGETSFRGTWTLEIVAHEPVKVYPNVRICSISYSPAVGLTNGYCGKYNDQRGPVASRMWKDFVKD